MHLVFDSLTGNVRRLAHRIAARAAGMDVQDVRSGWIGDPFLLLTYTFHRGDVPESTRAFLRGAGRGLRGVVASGSYHWGTNFARAADVIAAEHAVPIIAKVNKGGTDADVALILAWLASATAPNPTNLQTVTFTGGTHGTLD
ncbi:class Ib ribonucleoside-diphosphate reductase assembly flavoprotein NrdI [Deinococcus sp. KSM4-11]|uniref:class Ib ribonucleoside-diphosphate reductase assembly flavoprotein NrdI n=1 Tax=Deinococcus sp. KSM4-11 TaxID=2568654 RepID=UPI0010A527D7|nr:class Ib ribonucleoside-diphosphate reductase assembly flavoprotein NrdI [Deinococcus sp. KSM4-11]THF85523.1 class Ib ribonucleoside-diphosphate reductase assembly flavoprotein NrdI [Deinococcus sp. KSM4-11]